MQYSLFLCETMRGSVREMGMRLVLSSATGRLATPALPVCTDTGGVQLVVSNLRAEETTHIYCAARRHK